MKSISQLVERSVARERLGQEAFQFQDGGKRGGETSVVPAPTAKPLSARKSWLIGAVTGGAVGMFLAVILFSATKIGLALPAFGVALFGFIAGLIFGGAHTAVLGLSIPVIIAYSSASEIALSATFTALAVGMQMGILANANSSPTAVFWLLTSCMIIPLMAAAKAWYASWLLRVNPVAVPWTVGYLLAFSAATLSMYGTLMFIF